MVSEQVLYAFNWTSWSGIIAGGVTAIALSVLLAILGVALGFTVIKPKSEDPVSGLGTAFSVWSFISVIVCMAGGGFIAGLFSGQKGIEHGFMVWAIVVLAGTAFSTVAVGMAVRTIGHALKSAGAGAAEVASAVGKGAVNAGSAAIAELKENVDLKLDGGKLHENVAAVLRDTGVETLQPEYLQGQMREARSDLRKAVRRLSLAPSSYEQVIEDFLQTEKKRLESLSESIDKDAAVKALSTSRNIPEDEARTMVDNALEVYHQAVCKAREALAEAKAQAADAREYLKELAEEAREKADKMASAAAKAALAAALALVVAAFICMAAGVWGTRYSTNWYAVETNTYRVLR